MNFHFKFKRFFALLLTSCLCAVAPTIGHAQQQPIQDVLNSQNTPVLESVAQCLPTPEKDIDRADVNFLFGLIASVDSSSGSSGSKLHYISVFADYQDSPNADLTQLSHWTTLIELKSDGSCQNFIPNEQHPSVSLTKFMPLEQATQLAVARYRVELKHPSVLRDFKLYLQNSSVPFTSEGAEMDAVPSRGEDLATPRVCELNPEEAAAVTELGYSHKCNIRSVQ